MNDGHEVNEVVIQIARKGDGRFIFLTQVSIKHGIKHRRVGTHDRFAHEHWSILNFKHNTTAIAKWFVKQRSCVCNCNSLVVSTASVVLLSSGTIFASLLLCFSSVFPIEN